MVEQSLQVNIGFHLHTVPYKEILIPSNSIYNAFQTCNITALESAPANALLPILPSLVRLAVCPPFHDKSDFWYRQSKRFTQLISSFPEANLITPLFDLDYPAIEEDAVKYITHIKKLATVEGTSSSSTPSVLIGKIRDTAQLDFELSSPDRRMRLLVSELIRLSYLAAPYVADKYVPSELFIVNPTLPVLSRLLVQLTHQLPTLIPLPDLCESLLNVEPGPELVCSIAANNPNELESILFHILSQDESQEDHAQLNPLRVKCLCLLCTMSSAHFSIVRRRCVKLRKHLTIAFILALEESRLLDISTPTNTETDLEIELPSFSLDTLLSPPSSSFDPVLDFLGALLLTHSEENCWVSLYFKQTLRKNVPSRVFNSVKQHVISRLLQVVPEVGEGGKELGNIQAPHLEHTESDSHSEAGETELMEVEGSTCKVSVHPLSPTQFSHAAAVLRIFSVLRKLCPLPPNQNETDVIFNLIVTPAVSTSPSGVEFMKVSLGALIICPVFYNSAEKERLVLEWYHQVQQLLPEIEAESQDFQMRELLLTISSLCYNSSYQELSEVISDVMSIPLRNKSYQLNKSKEIFLRVFTEEKCNQMILTLPPTRGLNANHTDKLSIQSLLDFLQKKKKRVVSVSHLTEWILNQLLNCSLPLHPSLLLLLREYTAIILNEANPDLLFPRDDVIELYSDTSLLHDRDKRLAAQLLLLFYLLTLFSDETLPPSSPIMNYTVSILEHVPIKILLSKAVTHASQCSDLYPHLLRLVLHSLPQLWIPQNVLREFNGIHSGEKLESKCSPVHLEKTIEQKHHNFHVIFVLLKQLLGLHVDKLREFLPVLVKLIPILLSADMSRQTQNIYLTLWERLESVEPRKLWLATANSLRLKGSGQLKHDDLAQDPLLILHCDPRVFRVPPIYSLLLDTLAAYLAASRVYLYRVQKQREVEEKSFQDAMTPHDLRQAIISTQESATIQLLIEVCMPNEDDNDNLSPFGIQLTNLTEIQCLSCSLINQMIIADPNLARIIHVQGYPSHMIEMLVQGVPSMHICTDFIPDLLEETDNPTNIVFCVQLTACLCEQYPLHKAIGVCQRVLEFLSKRVRHLDSKERAGVFKPMLISLVHFAKTFPTLSEDITNLLLVVMKLEQAVTPETVVSRNAIKEKLGEDTSLAQAVADTFDVLLDEVVLKL